MFVQLLLLVHILSSTLLFGTGLGTAFHGWMAQRSRDLRAITVVNRQVFWADWLFTAPAVLVQPVTGFWLAHLEGIPLTTGWLALAIALYIMVGACWLPVVWLQIRSTAWPRRRWQLVRCRRSTPPTPVGGSFLDGRRFSELSGFSTSWS